jgi:hypothetical protein
MKKHLIFCKPLALLSVLGILTFSCSKEDTGPSPEKSMKIGDKEYALSKAELDYYGYISGSFSSYLFVVKIYDNKLVYNSLNDTYSGEEAGVNIGLYTSLETDIAEGVYTFDSYATGAPNTFNAGVVYTDFNPDTENLVLREVTGGTVTVAKTGEIYTITFNITLDSKETFTCTYKADISIVDKRGS